MLHKLCHLIFSELTKRMHIHTFNGQKSSDNSCPYQVNIRGSDTFFKVRFIIEHEFVGKKFPIVTYDTHTDTHTHTSKMPQHA